MLNYEVPPALLLPLVPAGTELDTWGGVTLASVVGFRFLDTRVLGMSIRGHRDFDEVNLRFYVRRYAEDGRWRRAVVFIRELVPRRAIATVARWFYNEPYSAVPMRHELEMAKAGDGEAGRAAYSWRCAGRWHRLEVKTRGLPGFPTRPPRQPSSPTITGATRFSAMVGPRNTRSNISRGGSGRPQGHSSTATCKRCTAPPSRSA